MHELLQRQLQALAPTPEQGRLVKDNLPRLERPEAVLRGSELLRQQLGANKVVIGVERNKLEAVRVLRAHSKPAQPVQVFSLKVKYPQGAERILLKTLLGAELPSGSVPLDHGIVVNNVATMAALADALDCGIPLIERVVTVAGPALAAPANLRVAIGTPVRQVLAFCGGCTQENVKVIMGGPMMGLPLGDLDVPILKSSTGILVFPQGDANASREYSCIRCGRCLDACPLFLNPSLLNRLAKAGLHQEVARHHGLDCMECGSCTFACPSAIPIVQRVRMAKASLRKDRNR